MATSVSGRLLCKDPTSYWEQVQPSSRHRVSNASKAVYTKGAEGGVTPDQTTGSLAAFWWQHFQLESEVCRGLPCAILVHDQPDLVETFGSRNNPNEPANRPSPSVTRAEADVAAIIDDEHVEARFRGLADWWREETGLFSFEYQMERHPAYKQIVEIGEKAIPLVLTELQERPYRWFGVLQALTGANPVSSDAAGDFDQMSKAWEEWGKTKGY